MRTCTHYRSTVLLPSAAFVWTYPDSIARVVISAPDKGTWMNMTFTRYWLEAVRGPANQTRLEIADPHVLSCHENAIYIDERSYMGREVQPSIRAYVHSHIASHPTFKLKSFH